MPTATPRELPDDEPDVDAEGMADPGTGPSLSRPADARAPRPRPATAWSSPAVEPPAMFPLLQPALLLISGALVVLMLWSGREILVPLALGALLAFVLDPLVERLVRRHVPRVLAVGVVVASAVLAISASSVFVAGQAMSLGRDVPTYQATMQSKLRALRQQMSGRGVLDDLGRMIEVVSDELDATRRVLVAHAGGAPERQAMRVEIAPTKPSALQALGALVEPVLAPAASTGLVLLFLLFILLDRNDLRDRALRLFGGDLLRSTAALKEASDRVSRYLTMQLLVNAGYGITLAGGLALIGMPGALLWGALGAVLRFIPYIGPLFATVGPLLLAFVIDPGWQLLLSASLLILTLELLINNVVEPWVYGSSTGLSPTALLVSAAFWTGLWGPVGLVLATPLTVLIVVMGRHIPRLQWLDLLLGSTPAFDPATRLYQRLLAGDIEEATQLAIEQARQLGPQGFYGGTGMPVLRLATDAHHQATRPEQRHRLTQGLAQMLDELAEDFPVPRPAGAGPGATGLDAEVVCIGGRWQADALAARMCAHALSLQGVAARALPPSAVLAERLEQAPLAHVRLVVLGYFDPDSATHARYVCRRLRRRWPQLRIVLARWQSTPLPGQPTAGPAPAALPVLDDGLVLDAQALGADALVHSLDEAVLQVHAMGVTGRAPVAAPRAQAPTLDGLLDPALRPLLALTTQRAADLFDVATSRLLLWADDGRLLEAAGPDDVLGPVVGAPLEPDVLAARVAATVRERWHTVHIADLARDAGHAALAAALQPAPRSCVGVPLRLPGEGRVVGLLWLADVRPRALHAAELALLQSLADDLMGQLLRWIRGIATDAVASRQRPEPPGLPPSDHSLRSCPCPPSSMPRPPRSLRPAP